MARSEFSAICRLCVQVVEEREKSPIFNNEMFDDKISLSEKIKYCSSVEVLEDDGLPPHICSSCLFKLNESFVFRNQCILADIALKHLVKNVNFNFEELSNLLKIDIKNQIIHSDYISVYEIDTLGKTEEVDDLKKEINIDEFDNSQNGRHKRNIDKSKENLRKKIKILNVKNELKRDDIHLKSTNKSKSHNFKKEQKTSKRSNKTSKTNNKLEDINKIEKEGTETSPREDSDFGNNETLKENYKDKIKENFTISSDSFNIKEEAANEDTQTENLNLNIDKQKKTLIKTIKPNTLGIKKVKKKKLSVPKEKPSSYTCDYCQKVYPSEGGWRYHIHTMHNENYQPFICDLCGQTFKVKKNLEGHKNSIHFHLKLHLCDLCGRGFASKYALKVHKIWHSDEKNYSCDICGTKFRTRGKMNTHRSIHGGPKKFMCHICSRDFRWKKDFEIHMRTHTGEKPFKCSHCGKAFASLTNMKKHERNHLQKMGVVKDCGPFDTVSTPDNIFCKNDLLDFGYGCEDIRN